MAKLLLKYRQKLIIPDSLKGLFGSDEQLERYLNRQLPPSTYWHTYIAHKTKGSRRTAGYLGRYVRRPPVAASRLRHYNGDGNHIFNYLDHRSGQRVREVVTPYEMVCQMLRHIYERHFRTIRYYGFLSNRIRGQKHPLVYSTLDDHPQIPFHVTHASLAKAYLGSEPYHCSCCGTRLRFKALYPGFTVKKLMDNWEAFALERQVVA
ncbi:transposase [Dongshaea marina]|uniref:transposase n=1 Tax=Dongshaea marina TaxID=2047966 RepID=UPI000D3E656D|nr:transposase [Dongshaea marina]